MHRQQALLNNSDDQSPRAASLADMGDDMNEGSGKGRTFDSANRGELGGPTKVVPGPQEAILEDEQTMESNNNTYPAPGHLEDRLNRSHRVLYIEQAPFVSNIADDVERHERETDAAEPDARTGKRRWGTRIAWRRCRSLSLLSFPSGSLSPTLSHACMPANQLHDGLHCLYVE